MVDRPFIDPLDPHSYEQDPLLGSDPYNDGRKERGSVAPAVEIVRVLGPDDLPALLNKHAGSTEKLAIHRMRHAHHQLAQVVARGATNEEASLITGYAPEYISRIQKEDPAFKELLRHYAGETEVAFTDVLQRMRTLGLTATDLLQERLTEAPESWSNSELMELQNQTLVKPLQVAGAIAGGSRGSERGVSISVNFVDAGDSRKDGPVIDMEPGE